MPVPAPGDLTLFIAVNAELDLLMLRQTHVTLGRCYDGGLAGTGEPAGMIEIYLNRELAPLGT